MKKFAAGTLIAVAVTALFAGCTNNKAAGSCEGDKACTDTSATCETQAKSCCSSSAAKACTKSETPAN
ncbi:MAG: hypothetical protein KF745_13380 [Phycisphaeraceae bacterium]|nr:hypothetical protein [Phycisphaeraceae bacterium]